MNTAEIATNVQAETTAMYERMSAAAVYTTRELATRKWMLDSVTVEHTDTTVAVRFGRGNYPTLIDTLGTALLDKASEHLPPAVGGRITVNGRTVTLTF